MSWFYNGSSVKSFADIDKLIHNVIRHEDFKASDFSATFSTAREAERMDKERVTNPSNNSSSNLPFRPEDGWNIGSVSIPVPCDGVRFRSKAEAPCFIIDKIWYRRPLEVIKMAFTEPATENFILSHSRSIGNLQMMNLKNDYIQKHSLPMFSMNTTMYSELPLGKALIASWSLLLRVLFFYSDATHLANFGTASLYPMYMYIGNQSQYTRPKPSEFSAHHIAYIPKVFSSRYIIFLLISYRF
jgi:hypothetical protein